MSINSVIKNFFIRFFHGSKLSLLSLKAYGHYKKLALIPYISSLFFGILFGGLITAQYAIAAHTAQGSKAEYLLHIPLILLFFWCASCLHVFFSMMTTFLMDQYCENNKASLYKAFVLSLKKIKNILVWASLDTIIRFSSASKDKGSDSMWDFVSKTSWRYLSFFIYPVFAFEQKTFYASLKQSTHLMKTYFGSASGSIFTFSVFLRFIPFILMGNVAVLKIVLEVLEWITKNTSFEHYFTRMMNSKYFIMFGLAPYLAGNSWFMYEFIMTAQVIASVMLYRYVHNMPTGIFNRATLEAAVKSRQDD